MKKHDFCIPLLPKGSARCPFSCFCCGCCRGDRVRVGGVGVAESCEVLGNYPCMNKNPSIYFSIPGITHALKKHNVFLWFFFRCSKILSFFESTHEANASGEALADQVELKVWDILREWRMCCLDSCWIWFDWHFLFRNSCKMKFLWTVLGWDESWVVEFAKMWLGIFLRSEIYQCRLLLNFAEKQTFWWLTFSEIWTSACEVYLEVMDTFLRHKDMTGHFQHCLERVWFDEDIHIYQKEKEQILIDDDTKQGDF